MVIEMEVMKGNVMGSQMVRVLVLMLALMLMVPMLVT